MQQQNKYKLQQFYNYNNYNKFKNFYKKNFITDFFYSEFIKYTILNKYFLKIQKKNLLSFIEFKKQKFKIRSLPITYFLKKKKISIYKGNQFVILKYKSDFFLNRLGYKLGSFSFTRKRNPKTLSYTLSTQQRI